MGTEEVSASDLEGGAARVRELVDTFDQLISTYIRADILWYQSHKRWPRRIHRATTAAILLSGASIPILAASEFNEARWVTAALGVVVTVLAGLNSSYKWERTWRVFAEAQAELEFLVAKWDIEVVAATTLSESQDVDVHQLRGVVVQLLENASSIRARERGEFFSQTDDKQIEKGLPTERSI